MHIQGIPENHCIDDQAQSSQLFFLSLAIPLTSFSLQAAGGRLPARWLEGVLHQLKHQGPERVLKHLTWLAARYASPTIQEKLAYLQKREGHMQYPIYQAAGWPIGSGSVESANKVVVEARLKGARMRWERHNVNPVLVLRNAVCNRRWSETWQQAVTQRRTARTQRRHERSQHRLRQACWALAIVGVRLHWISQPPVPVSSQTMGRVSTEMPARRPASGYFWRKPFLRRPLSPPVASEKVGAKNKPHPSLQSHLTARSKPC